MKTPIGFSSMKAAVMAALAVASTAFGEVDITALVRSEATPTITRVEGSVRKTTEDVDHAFDGNTGKDGRVMFSTKTGAIQYDIPDTFRAGEPIKLKSYKLMRTKEDDSYDLPRAPTQFKLEAFDGTSWVTLHEKTASDPETSWSGTVKEITYEIPVANRIVSRSYRFSMYANNGSTHEACLSLNDLTFYGDVGAETISALFTDHLSMEKQLVVPGGNLSSLCGASVFLTTRFGGIVSTTTVSGFHEAGDNVAGIYLYENDGKTAELQFQYPATYGYIYGMILLLEQEADGVYATITRCIYTGNSSVSILGTDFSNKQTCNCYLDEEAQKTEDGGYFSICAKNLDLTFYAATGLQTVRFLDKDGNLITEQQVNAGEGAVAPTPPEVDGYKFWKWSIDFSKVYGNIDVNALYHRLCTVTFMGGIDGETWLEDQTVEQTYAAVAPEAPVIPNYEFLNWDVDFSYITNDLTVTAVYIRTYQVVFKNPDGTVLGTQTVRKGSAAVAPDMTDAEYQALPFFGWEGDFSCVTSDLEIVAYYGVRPNYAKHFTVTIPANYSQGACATYPILVRLSETGISGFSYSDFQLNGRDLYIEDAAGNPLPYELAVWNTAGESLLYVQVTSALEGTAIMISYGGTMACESPAGMWAGYAGVWHFEEADGTAADATGHGLVATPHGVTDQMVASDDAVIGRSRVNASANGTANGMGVSADINNYITDASVFTVEGWFKATDVGGYTRVFSRKNSYSDGPGFEIEYDSGSKTSGKVTGKGSSPRLDFRTEDTTAGWQKLTYVVDGATASVYTNGALSASGAITAVEAASVGFSIGNDADFNERQWWGMIDEVKFYDGVKSADQIAFEYAQEAGTAEPLVYGAAVANDTTKPNVVTVTATSTDGETMTVTVGLTTLGDNAESAAVYISYGPDAEHLCAPVKLAEGNVSPLVGTIPDLTSCATYVYSVYVENNLGQVSETKASSFRVAAATTPVSNPLFRAGLLQGKINTANDFTTDILANSVIPLEVVPGVVMALYKVDSGKEGSVFYTSPYTGHQFKWNGSNTTFGYYGEIYLPVGELHVGKNIDDSAYVKIGDTVVLNHTTYNAYPVATLAVEQAGWYSLEVRLGDGSGGKGITDTAKFENNGLAYNIDGTTDPAKTGWLPLMDTEGSLLRYVDDSASYLAVGPVTAGDDGSVTAWLSVDGAVPSAAKLVALYDASDKGENAAAWKNRIVLAELAAGESLASTKFTLPNLAKYAAVRFALVGEATEAGPAFSQFTDCYAYEQILPIAGLTLGEITEEGVAVTLPVEAFGAGAESASLHLEYSLTADFADSDFIDIGDCTELGEVAFSITTLAPATTYFVRAVVENAKGERNVSETVQFTTYNSAIAHEGETLVWIGGVSGTWDDTTANWLSPKGYQVAWVDGCTVKFTTDAVIAVSGEKSILGMEVGANVTLSGDAITFLGEPTIVYNDDGTLRIENDVIAANGIKFNIREQKDEIHAYEIEGNITDEDQLLFSNVNLDEMDAVVGRLHCQFGGASGEYTINSSLPNKNNGGRDGDNGIFHFVKQPGEWTCQFQGVIYGAACLNVIKLRLHQVGNDVWGYREYKRSLYAQSAKYFGTDFDTNGVTGDGYDEWLFNLELRRVDHLPTECRTELAGAYTANGVETVVNGGTLAICGEQTLNCRLRAQNGGAVEFAKDSVLSVPAANGVVFYGAPFYVYGTMNVGNGSGNYGLIGSARDGFYICDGGRFVSPSIYDPYGYNGCKITVLTGGVLETVGNWGIGCNGNDIVLAGGQWLQSYDYTEKADKGVALKSVTLSDGASITGSIGTMGHDYYDSDFTISVVNSTPCSIELDQIRLGSKNKAIGTSGYGCKGVFNVADVTGDEASDLIVNSDFVGAEGMTVAEGGESKYYLRKKGAGTLELTGANSCATNCQFQIEAGTVKLAAGVNLEFGTFMLKGSGTLALGDGAKATFAGASTQTWADGATLNLTGDISGLSFGPNGLTDAQLAAITINGKPSKVRLTSDGHLRMPGFQLIIR